MKKAYVNVVASPLMKDLALKRIKSKRISVRKITPIDKTGIYASNDTISKKILEQMEKSKFKMQNSGSHRRNTVIRVPARQD